MSDSIASSWKRITAWLNDNAPDLLEDVDDPVTAEDLDAAAEKLGLQFPDELRQFFLVVAGAEESGIFPSVDEWDEMAFSPMSLEASIDAWEMLKELVEMGEFADLEPESAEGIAGDWWNTGWIPFADNGGGDYWCVDLAPTETGTVGQLISHNHESGEHEILAPSLSSYLAQLAERLEAGKLSYDEEYGLGNHDD